jgi:hypothetical protein
VDVLKTDVETPPSVSAILLTAPKWAQTGKETDIVPSPTVRRLVAG